MEHARLDRGAALLVLGSATAWSFGGAIARFLTVQESWTVVFWRSTFAALFLLAFMLWRDGLRGTRTLFLAMGWPGLAVGACFAIASTSFVSALAYTSVANVLLMQAGVPLIAALLSALLFREHVSAPTWLAIAAVIAGVAIMVSDSLSGSVSPIGDALALLIALAFAGATVITRRHAHVAMMPAVLTGCTLAALFAAWSLPPALVSGSDFVLLFAFGALNLGLGMALFVTGARRVPAAIAALIGIAEPVLGPLWVWLIHQETPRAATLWGGGVVCVALLAHVLWQMRDTPPAQT
jgi:drug/metabolite transporter (DMT)-like permease